MDSLLDDIEKLLNLGVGYGPRLNKIKRNLKKNQTLWPADSLYIRQLCEHYLHSKPSKETSTTKYTFQTINDENHSSKVKTKPSVQSIQTKQKKTPFKEKIIVIGTGCALALFFMFVIFPIPQPPPSANGFANSESSSLGFLSSNVTTKSNTSIKETISLSADLSDQASFTEPDPSKIEFSSDTST